ncbi:MAG: hypothetical protein HY537_07795, partial [Deltaproteobacteria bacterium]|nr:hypothetical protein [Deltaproteobacteria bacterium]
QPFVVFSSRKVADRSDNTQGRSVGSSMSFIGLLISALVTGQLALADAPNSGWKFSQSCSSYGTKSRGAFSGQMSNTFAAGGRTACSRTGSRFTKFSFTSFSGEEPNPALFNANSGEYEVFSVDTGDFMVTPPLLSLEKQPIFTVNASCPTKATTVNWITSQWTDAETTSLQNTYLLGTASIAANTGALTITGQYDVRGTGYWLGAIAMNLEDCSNGQAVATGSGNLAGTFYYKPDGGGVYKSNSGRAFFMMPQKSMATFDFSNKTFQGILFNSQSAGSVKQIQVSSDINGTVFTVRPFTDVSAGVVGNSFIDTISISNVNYPVNGMMIGTVTRTGTGAGGPTKIGCIVNKHLSKGLRVICSGQSPNDRTLPYNVTFNSEADSSSICPANYVLVRGSVEVGAPSDFCIAKYEMKIQGKDEGDQLLVRGPRYDSAWVAESRATGTPWVRITRDNAILECQSLGIGYDLMTNGQWQATARDIELAQNEAGDYLNWSNGSIEGANAINRGHSDGSPQNSLAAGTDNNPCAGTGNAGCGSNSHVNFNQKRTHTLSTGDVIWDLAGNVMEWVKDNNMSAQGRHGYLSEKTWDGRPDARETPASKLKWGPSGIYTAKRSGEYGGLGYGYLNLTRSALQSVPLAIMRGGRYYQDLTQSGIFYVFLGATPASSGPTTGFRCSFNPEVVVVLGRVRVTF